MASDNRQKIEQACELLKAYRETPFIRYEWEELLEKLSCSDDPNLRRIALREREATLDEKPSSS